MEENTVNKYRRKLAKVIRSLIERHCLNNRVRSVDGLLDDSCPRKFYVLKTNIFASRVSQLSPDGHNALIVSLHPQTNVSYTRRFDSSSGWKFEVLFRWAYVLRKSNFRGEPSTESPSTKP